MDAPEIVKRAGGVLHGSASTVNVGRGAGLDERLPHRRLLFVPLRAPGRFTRTKELLDRKSAESGIPVRFQQAFETITSFT